MLPNSLAPASDNIGRLAVAIGKIADTPTIHQANLVYERRNHVLLAGVIVAATWVVCTFDERFHPWAHMIIWAYLAIMELYGQRLLVAPIKGSPPVDADYHLLRAFFYTTATDDKLLKLVLKKTDRRDLSDPRFDPIRAAVERCRMAV